MTYELARVRAQVLANRLQRKVSVYRSDYGTNPYHASHIIPVWGKPTGDHFTPEPQKGMDGL